jgi:uncharacterized membrane protein YhaH (DUF805 family)
MTSLASASAPLDQPLYGATPVQAVSRFFRKYATFSGRASRSEFWWVSLFLFVVFLLIWIPGIIVGVATGTPGTDSYGRATTVPGPAFAIFAILGVLVYLAVVVPGIAVTVRRLHDANFSGLLYLLSFIPSIGGIILFVLTVLPSNPQGARFDLGAATYQPPVAPPTA